MKRSTQTGTLADKLCSEKFFYMYIILTMTLIPAGELITEIFQAPFVTQPVILSVSGLAGLAAGMISLTYKRESKKYYPSDIFYVLLIVFAALSLVFSKNFDNSCTGFYYDELPLHFMAYFSLMLAGTAISDGKLRKNILLTFCAVAVLQGIVAFFQTFGFQIAWCFYDTEWHNRDMLAYGLTQHNNWFAGLSVIFAAAASGMFIFSDKKKKLSYAYLALSALIIYASFCTGARLSWVGNAVIILFYPISFIVMKRRGYDRKNLRQAVLSYLTVLVVYAAVIAVIALTRDTFSNIISEFASEDFSDFDSLGTSRGYIWKYGLESIPHNWLLGVGLDNYAYAFSSSPNWSEGMRFQDKGHNEYLHTIVTQGVFAGANYIAMLIYAAVTGVKSVIGTKDESERRITWIFLTMFMGYAAQAFFNSSVINTAMYFWIVVGMTMPRKSQKPINFGKKTA